MARCSGHMFYIGRKGGVFEAGYQKSAATTSMGSARKESDEDTGGYSIPRSMTEAVVLSLCIALGSRRESGGSPYVPRTQAF